MTLQKFQHNIKKITTKKKNFYGALAIIIIIILGFSSDYALNWRKQRNELKKDKKELQQQNKQLQTILDNSDNYQELEAEVGYNWYYDYQKEKKLREKYEQENFIFRNYTRFSIDSFLSRYQYRPELERED